MAYDKQAAQERFASRRRYDPRGILASLPAPQFRTKPITSDIAEASGAMLKAYGEKRQRLLDVQAEAAKTLEAHQRKMAETEAAATAAGNEARRTALEGRKPYVEGPYEYTPKEGGGWDKHYIGYPPSTTPFVPYEQRTVPPTDIARAAAAEKASEELASSIAEAIPNATTTTWVQAKGPDGELLWKDVDKTQPLLTERTTVKPGWLSALSSDERQLYNQVEALYRSARSNSANIPYAKQQLDVVVANAKRTGAEWAGPGAAFASLSPIKQTILSTAEAKINGLITRGALPTTRTPGLPLTTAPTAEAQGQNVSLTPTTAYSQLTPEEQAKADEYEDPEAAARIIIGNRE